MKKIIQRIKREVKEDNLTFLYKIEMIGTYVFAAIFVLATFFKILPKFFGITISVLLFILSLYSFYKKIQYETRSYFKIDINSIRPDYQNINQVEYELEIGKIINFIYKNEKHLTNIIGFIYKDEDYIYIGECKETDEGLTVGKYEINHFNEIMNVYRERNIIFMRNEKILNVKKMSNNNIISPLNHLNN